MKTSFVVAHAAMALSLMANAETYTVPANTSESVTVDTVGKYNDYDEVVVSERASLGFSGPGSIPFTPMLKVDADGSVSVSNAADVVLGANQVEVKGVMSITNATVRRADGLPVPAARDDQALMLKKGILTIEDGGVLSNRLVVGASGWAWGHVIQSGGTVVNLGGGDESSWPVIGGNGGGYYELRNGTHEIIGSAKLGTTSYGTSVFAMYGGVLLHTKKGDEATIKCNTASFGPVGYYQWGGAANFGEFITGNWSAPMVMLVSGDGTVFGAKGFSAVQTAAMNNQAHVLTIAKGARWDAKLSTAGSHSNYGDKLVFVVNFDGATASGRTDYSYFSNCHNDSDVADSPSIRNVVYSGGLTFDTNGKNGTEFIVPLRGATGKGVASVDWSSVATRQFNYCPVISIRETGENGKGYGASAVVKYDSETRRITDVEVVSPGCDYTEATAYLLYGDSYGGDPEDTVLLPAELAENRNDGGFKLTGADSRVVNFCTWNSYGGATEVENGMLYAKVPGSIPTNTALRLTGGALYLSGDRDATFRSIGGNGGSIAYAKSEYEVVSLDIDTERTLDLSAMTLTVTGRWDVAAADIAAGKCADYDSTIVFADTATVDVSDLADLDVSRYVLARATLGMTGTPTPVGAKADEWRLVNRNNALVLSRKHGLAVVFR